MAPSLDSSVVLLSGGLDSTVLLHHVIKDLLSPVVHAVSFNYGQRHVRELDCARRQAALLKVAEHRIIDVAFLGELLAPGTTLVVGGAEVPDLQDLGPEQRRQPPTYVPNRNMLLLSLAAAYAEAQGIHRVFYGAQAQDEYGYWDCTAEFLARVNQVLALNRATPVEVCAPFIDLQKAAIVAIGRRLDVDFSQTWSCYRGGEQACGVCPTCIERRRAFRDADVMDPLSYA